LYRAYFNATTLFQAYKEHKPDLKSRRIFGYVTYLINIHGHFLTYDPKILDQHIFVGIKRDRVWRLLNKKTKKEHLFTNVKFNKYLFPKLSDIANKTVVLVLQNTCLSQLSLLALLISTISSLPNTRPAGQQRTRPGNTELRDTQLYTTDKRKALSSITSSHSGRLSSSRRVRLSSTASGSGATRLDITTYRPTKDTIFKLTRSEKVPKQTIFSDLVMQLVTKFKAIHLKKDKSSLVQAFAPSFKAITLKEAIRENAPKWLKAFVSELQSLKDINTYRIVNTLNRRKVIISR
jgi:hypothetical protein